jgi:GT2 family glycosyltransferase
VADLSVCIVNWNTREHLRHCLEALHEHHGRLDLQVIVVDNASSDGSADMVRADFTEVVLIVNDDNVGYARGNNQALERADAEFALLLNPDTIVTDGALRALLDCAARHPKAGGLAPRLVYPDGRLQHSCRSFPTPDAVIYEVLGLSRLFPRSRRFGKYKMTWWRYDDERQVDQPMASAFLLRREAAREVGVFDEDFPIFFNDVDLCQRLRDAGWEIWFTPEATVIHAHAASTSQVRRRMIVESHGSFLRYYRKHYRGRANPLAYWTAVALLRVAEVVRLAFSGR